MAEKYKKEEFVKRTSKPEDRLFLVMIAIANELADLNNQLKEIREEKKSL